MMNIRRAKSSDKDLVLDFCVNTFAWGDYLDRVWDVWFSDPSGLLFVYDSSNFPSISKSIPLGIIHIVKCLGDILWLEGLRVNKIHRNRGIATALLKYSLIMESTMVSRKLVLWYPRIILLLKKC